MKYTEMGLADLEILLTRLFDERNDLVSGDPERAEWDKKILKVDDRMNFIMNHAFGED